MIVMCLLVSFHDKLMRACNELDPIRSVKLLDDVTTKEIACASGTHGPTMNVVWVRPHKVAHCTIMGHFLLAVDDLDLIES